MSKLYKHYKKCKEASPEKVILIKAGLFYVLLDEDAKNLCERLGLNLAMLNKDVVKCGFPVGSFSKYEKMLIANSIDFWVTELEPESQTNGAIEKAILKEIKNLDLDGISPIKAFNLLVKYKERLKSN